LGGRGQLHASDATGAGWVPPRRLRSTRSGGVATACGQGRSRLWGTGFDHQRPEKRQRGTSAGAATLARGMPTSSAATIAATSSSVASAGSDATVRDGSEVAVVAAADSLSVTVGLLWLR